MAVKPDTIEWVNDDDAAKISAPGFSKKTAGFLYKEKPAFQFLNWIFNQSWKWFRGLQGSYFDYVVGSATQVTLKQATHTINTLGTPPAGAKILLLDGTHVLSADLTITNNNINIFSESRLAIISLNAAQILTISGNDIDINTIFTNVGGGQLIITGTNCKATVSGINLSNINSVKTCILLTPGVFGYFIKTNLATINAGTSSNYTITHGLGTDDVEVFMTALGGDANLSNASDYQIDATRPDGKAHKVLGPTVVAMIGGALTAASTGQVKIRVGNLSGVNQTFSVYVSIRPMPIYS